MHVRRFATSVLVLAVALGVVGHATTDATASDTPQSFVESPGCGALDGTKGPLMGPGPRESWFNYASLPTSTELFGPWADYYGRTIGDVYADTVVVDLPTADPTDVDGVVKVRIHERVVPAFEQAVANMEAYRPEGEDPYAIYASQTGGFNQAVIPPGRHLSFHGVGAALDINWNINQYRPDNVLVTDFPEWFVDAWRDAGWCWGGDWVSIKDAMHFAWMGPVHDGSAEQPPYPATTTASAFDTTATIDTAFDPGFETVERFAIDINRDGAPDILRLHEHDGDGTFRVEISESWRDYETCATTNWSPIPALERSGIAVGDHDADGRPEIWLFDETGTETVVAIYSLVQHVGGFSTYEGTPTLVDTITTGADPAAGGVYRIADHDRDGYGDLYVIIPGATTTLQVWAGPDLTTTLVNRTIGISSTESWDFGVGDHDLDGIPDLYALSDGDPATLRIVHGASGFSGAMTTIATGITVAPDESLSVEDFDGDGRDDLFLIGPSGDGRVVLGGERGADDLTEWFVERDLSWNVGIGCLVVPPVTDILDPGFESGAKADSPHGFSETGGGSWAITSGAARSESFGARYDATSQTDLAILEINGPRDDGSTHIQVTPGQVVGFSAWVKASSDSTTNRLRPRLNFYTATGSYVDGVANVAVRPGTAWEQITVSGVVPPGAAFVTMEMRVHADGHGGSYSIDDLELVGPSIPPDEITDGGFESGTFDAHALDAGGGTWSIVGDPIHTGTFAAAFDSTGQTDIALLWANGEPGDASTHVPVTDGELIGFTAWIRSDDPASTNRMRPRIQFFDAKGRWLDGIAPAATIPGTTWTKVSIAGLAPADAAFAVLQIRIHPDGHDGSYFVDDLQLVAVQPVPGDIVDSGFESGGLSQYDPSAAGGAWSVGTTRRSGSYAVAYDPAGQTSIAVLGANGSRRDPDHVTVTPGGLVGFSAWVSSSSDEGANRVRPRIHFFDADWNYIVGETMNVTEPTTQWRLINVGAVVPDGAVYAVFQVRVHSDGMPALVYVDDLRPSSG